MNKTSSTITRADWQRAKYPYDAYVMFQTDPANPDIYERSGATITIFRKIKGVKMITPTRMFDDPGEQRQYLIDTILDLFKDDHTRIAVSINFGTVLSEPDHQMLWPDWKLPASPIIV